MSSVYCRRFARRDNVYISGQDVDAISRWGNSVIELYSSYRILYTVQRESAELLKQLLYFLAAVVNFDSASDRRISPWDVRSRPIS